MINLVPPVMYSCWAVGGGSVACTPAEGTSIAVGNSPVGTVLEDGAIIASPSVMSSAEARRREFGQGRFAMAESRFKPDIVKGLGNDYGKDTK